MAEGSSGARRTRPSQPQRRGARLGAVPSWTVWAAADVDDHYSLRGGGCSHGSFGPCRRPAAGLSTALAFLAFFCPVSGQSSCAHDPLVLKPLHGPLLCHSEVWRPAARAVGQASLQPPASSHSGQDSLGGRAQLPHPGSP